MKQLIVIFFLLLMGFPSVVVGQDLPTSKDIPSKEWLEALNTIVLRSTEYQNQNQNANYQPKTALKKGLFAYDNPEKASIDTLFGDWELYNPEAEVGKQFPILPNTTLVVSRINFSVLFDGPKNEDEPFIAFVIDSLRQFPLVDKFTPGDKEAFEKQKEAEFAEKEITDSLNNAEFAQREADSLATDGAQAKVDSTKISESDVLVKNLRPRDVVLTKNPTTGEVEVLITGKRRTWGSPWYSDGFYPQPLYGYQVYQQPYQYMPPYGGVCGGGFSAGFQVSFGFGGGFNQGGCFPQPNYGCGNYGNGYANRFATGGPAFWNGYELVPINFGGYSYGNSYNGNSGNGNYYGSGYDDQYYGMATNNSGNTSTNLPVWKSATSGGSLGLQKDFLMRTPAIDSPMASNKKPAVVTNPVRIVGNVNASARTTPTPTQRVQTRTPEVKNPITEDVAQNNNRSSGSTGNTGVTSFQRGSSGSGSSTTWAANGTTTTTSRSGGNSGNAQGRVSSGSQNVGAGSNTATQRGSVGENHTPTNVPNGGIAPHVNTPQVRGGNDQRTHTPAPVAPTTTRVVGRGTQQPQRATPVAPQRPARNAPAARQAPTRSAPAPRPSPSRTKAPSRTRR